MLGGAEHKGLIHLSQTVSFSFCLVESHGELLLRGLKKFDVRRSPIQKRNLGRLLVGYGKHVLEPAITISELVPAALFRFDALAADLFAALLDKNIAAGSRLELLVIVVVTANVGLGPCNSLACLPVSTTVDGTSPVASG